MIYAEYPSLDATFHFALEQHILNAWDAPEDVLMFWRTEPTLMIGRYQNALAEIDLAYARERGIHIVRRVTGGGAIFTDRGTWQFSVIANNEGRREIDFARFIAPVAAALTDLGLPVSFSTRNDITLDGKKISGNAQHVGQRRTLHHGSILFDADMDTLARALTPAPDKYLSKGISSVRQRVANIREYLSKDMTAEEFREHMLSRLLPPGHTVRTLTPEDLAATESIARERFRSWEWNFGSAPQFQLCNSRRFDGGKLEACLNVKQGRIVECKLYGDFFCGGDVATIEAALVGCPYREDEAARVLAELPASDLFFRISKEDLLACLFA